MPTKPNFLAPLWSYIAIASAAVVVLAMVVVFSRGKPEVSESFESGGAGSVKNDRVSRDRVLIGGVERSVFDVQASSAVLPSKVESPIKPHGYSPSLSPGVNPQVEMVSEAIRTRSNPERFSSFVVPHGFDSERFASEGRGYSEEYAKIVEPGRVFAPAQPGPGVGVISAAASRMHRVQQGESVRLVVKAPVDSPVTFTSFDLGQFENLLTSTTVVAGEDGKAEAVFTASGGTLDEVQILAASPVSTGQVAFTVSVQVVK